MKHYIFSTQTWHSSGEGSVKDIFFCPCFDFVSLHHGLASALGLQTAMDMQEKMTARRAEIDTLQSKIQQLEDTGEQLRQVRTIDLLCRTNVWASNSGQPLQIPFHSLLFLRSQPRHLTHFWPHPVPLQENSHQGAELQQQLLQLGLAKKEKRQLKDELEALRSKDKQFRNRIKQLEAILHKVWRFYNHSKGMRHTTR